jgi:hypothetical protein
MGRRGRPVTATKGKARRPKRISFALPDEVYRPLAHYVIDADTTIQAFVVEAIREKLQRECAAGTTR